MSARTALLIRCSKEEASAIHAQAARERRTVSAYVLNVMARALQLEAKLNTTPELARRLYSSITRDPGPRSAILVRCTIQEARNVRGAARLRGATISSFVLHALRRSWSASAFVARPQ